MYFLLCQKVPHGFLCLFPLQHREEEKGTCSTENCDQVTSVRLQTPGHTLWNYMTMLLQVCYYIFCILLLFIYLLLKALLLLADVLSY